MPEADGYDLATLNGLVRGGPESAKPALSREGEADARRLCRKCFDFYQEEGSPFCARCRDAAIRPPCGYCGECAKCKRLLRAIKGVGADVRQRFDPDYRGRWVTRTWIVSAVCVGTILAWLWLLAAAVAR